MADEYIRKADAVEETLKYIISSGVSNQSTWNECVRTIADTLQDMRPADVVQVVRCKDCERCEYDAVCGQIGRLWCKLRRLVKPDSFCDLGKRREE